MSSSQQFNDPFVYKAPIRVLFLSPHNRARSQMAEALVRHLSHGKVFALSAGSHPASCIHPYAVRAMHAAIGIDISFSGPKHIKDLRGVFDYIITLYDSVLEVCPTFPGDPNMHWDFPDPAAVGETEEECYRAFEILGLELTMRIRLLLTLIEREKGNGSIR